MEKTYNGWKNYETWLVALWIDNDGAADYWAERAEEVRDVSDLANEMEAYYTEMASEVIPSQGMFNDLFNSALREVSWYDIAEHYINEAEYTQSALDQRERMESAD
jgi:hypothetical protein